MVKLKNSANVKKGLQLKFSGKVINPFLFFNKFYFELNQNKHMTTNKYQMDNKNQNAKKNRILPITSFNCS